MAQVSKILSIPIVLTEQKPKIFGSTFPEIYRELDENLIIYKEKI